MPDSASRNTGSVTSSEKQWESRSANSSNSAPVTPVDTALGRSGWEERRGYPMDSVRSMQPNLGRGGLELRLGGSQLAIWLGLVLGAIAGAYFVGFFAGRYVGFETARSASVGEVAKLTVPDDIYLKKAKTDKATSEIYGKLGAPSPNSDEASSEANLFDSVKRENTKGTDTKAAPSKAADMVQEIRENGVVSGNPSQVLEDKSKGVSTEGASAVVEIDSVFTDAELGTKGLKPSELADKSSKSAGVRVLGESPKQQPSSDEKSADASMSTLLEERVAKAKQKANGDLDDSQDLKKTKAQQEIEDQANRGIKELNEKSSRSEKKSEETSEKANSVSAGSIMKPVLPKGFFAQVAAPKKIAEAQEVAKQLKRSGFPVMIETAHVRGEDYFRVLVGPEESKVHAERLVEQLKRESYLTGTAFLRKVK